MSLGSKWRAKDDEIFSDAGMNDVHGTHGTACIVEDPFILVRVESYLFGWISKCEVRDDVVNHSGGVVG